MLSSTLAPWEICNTIGIIVAVYGMLSMNADAIVETQSKITIAAVNRMIPSSPGNHTGLFNIFADEVDNSHVWRE